MSRISKAFQQKAKIAYLTAGDGNSVDYFLSLLRGGANLLEIGIPFSDPIADGPTIQKAMQRAIQYGTTPEKVLDIVRQIRAQSDAALILFTYLNPIQKDLLNFLSRAKAAGADGILVVDLPHEEARAFQSACKQIGLAAIAVATPSTPLERIARLTKQSDGFLYYACRKGTTGAKDSLPLELSTRLTEIRAQSHLPVAVGFGIAKRDAVQKIMPIADGCVVGSHFVSAVEKGCSPQELEKITQEIFSC